MRVLYFDCFSGASGDMILGALLDAGAPEDEVRRCLHGLRVDGWRLEVTTTTRGGLRACKATVRTQDRAPSRTHSDIVAIVESAALPANVVRRALDTFTTLADAEARVHDRPPGAVHFHEVGSLDAIIDIVGASAALEHFSPARVVVSDIATGTGIADAAHGSLPLPAPAVTEILAAAHAPLTARGDAELITPTGAALLATAADAFGELPPMRLERCGYGAGARELDHPNLLRVLVGESDEDATTDAVIVEANLDDIAPELMPHLIERLLSAGAQDAWITPILMKKGRPAYLLSALAGAPRTDAVIDVFWRESTTFGVRLTGVRKIALERSWIEVDVHGHPVRVKQARRAGKIVTAAPEHDDALTVARVTGLPLKRVYELALRAAEGSATPRKP